MHNGSTLLLMILASALIFAAMAAAQCTVPADTDPCDDAVNITELNYHISKWYKCSACVPDLFQAIQAYYNIPFCGDNKCNGIEDCSTCAVDCGACPPAFCSGVTVCSDYNAGNCTDPDPCDVSLTGCEWNSSISECQAVPGGCGNDAIDGTDVCDGTDLGGATCTGFGYDQGDLYCCPGCQDFNYSDCGNVTYSSCTDNDGVDYYTASGADYTFSSVYGPPCPGYPQRPPGGGPATSSDSCSGTMLTERTCTGNDLSSVQYDCSSEGMVCQGGACTSATELTVCQVIDTPDTDYFMNQDILHPTFEDCVVIHADNVTLDCKGHFITTNSTGSGYWLGKQLIGMVGIYSNGSGTTIRNCNVSDIKNGTGIFLEKANHSTLFKNIASNNLVGIDIFVSYHVNVSNNVANSNEFTAFPVYYSSYVHFQGNTANSNGVLLPSAGNGGFDIKYSPYVSIVNQTANLNTLSGIYSNSISKNLTVRNSLFIGNDDNAISVAGDNSTIMDNVIIGTGVIANYGIYINDADGTIIKGNRISNNYAAISASASDLVIEENVVHLNTGTGFSGLGINLHHEGGNIIRNNNVSSNNFGMYIVSDSNVIENNTVNSNNIGIELSWGISPVKFNIVRNNTVDDNSQDGINVDGGFNITIRDNIMRDNNKAILIEEDSQFIDILNNTIMSNTRGISVGSPAATDTNNTNITIRDNTICSNFLDVYCEDNQTFINNKCLVHDVCGGTCLQCW